MRCDSASVIVTIPRFASAFHSVVCQSFAKNEFDITSDVYKRQLILQAGGQDGQTHDLDQADVFLFNVVVFLVRVEDAVRCV